MLHLSINKQIMFRYLLLAAFYVTAVSSQAQIEINASDFPGERDTVRYSNALDFTIDYSATGEDYFWNFSDLNPDSQTLINHLSVDDADNLTQAYFGPFVMPAYRATYYLPATAIPFDDLGQFVSIPIENFYRFYRKTSSELNVIGLSLSSGGYGLGSRSDTIETAYQFPMQFGQQFNSRGYTAIDMSIAVPAQIKQYRQRESEVDGYGELMTPYGTFDVLRVHNRIHELDSVYFEVSGFGQWFALPVPVRNEYQWWTNGQKGAVLEVITNEIAGQEQVTEVRYRDNYRADLVASVEEGKVEALQIYPNPAAGKLFVKGVDSESHLTIYTASGQVLLEESYTTQGVNLSDWESGVYYVKITTGDHIVIKSFVKE